ncbi:MAG: MMPL family transporter, partial [Lentisphaerae bacterium]|nr:MMPL family transporter [Lentisphaerota bacterium]
MNKTTLTDFGLRRPGWVWTLALLLMIVFLAQFPKVKFDNDPENMLAEDEYIRVFHNSVKRQYALYDFVIVGIVNRDHHDGVFNVDTLGRVDDLTRQLISLRRGSDGRPEVQLPARAGRPAAVLQPDLQPHGAWKRLLAATFRQDAERLFTPEGASAIIVPEIISPSVVDNLRQADLGRLKIEYLMEEPPTTRAEALRVRDDALANPLYRGTMVSEDGRALAIYIPLVDKTYSHNVANLVEILTAEWSGGDEVYITGQPVAQDTFGVEMLVQMATSAPLAALAIFLLLYAFFRRVSLILAPMVVAMLSVIFTMGLLIGLGYDVHIMSSMIAIFLMPIAVADAIHMLSEFYDVYPRFRDKQRTVRHVVGHLFQPMLYTSLTTMAGFASLATTPIPPVRVFGLHVAFGVGVA